MDENGLFAIRGDILLRAIVEHQNGVEAVVRDHFDVGHCESESQNAGI
jgi:hypothetical protein